MLRIGIDAITPGGAIFATRGGVRTHVANLLQAMISVAPENEYVLFVSRRSSGLLENELPQLRKRICPSVPLAPVARVVYEQTAYPVVIQRENVDVFLGTSNVLPLLLPCPGVVILQTLQYFYFPESFRPLRRAYLRTMVPLSLRKASAVIAVTEYEKEDAVRWMRIPASKITAVPHGVSQFWFEPPTDQDQSLERGWVEKLSKGRPYLLSVSTLYHFKNFVRLLEAFALLKEKYKVPHGLIIAGSDADLTSHDLMRLAASLGIASDVVCAGRLEAGRVRALYRQAALMVYPSLYETFGLPLLEAMASGCPVVAARESCLPEVGGDAVEWVNPRDVADIAEGICTVISDGNRRDWLARHGKDRAQSFTWERSARFTLQILRKASNRG